MQVPPTGSSPGGVMLLLEVTGSTKQPLLSWVDATARGSSVQPLSE
jgi:hypothetical protein